MNVQLKTNTNRKYKTGTLWNTKSWGKIKVLGQVDRYYKYPNGKTTYCYILVEFSDGTQVIAETTNISKGIVRNPNTPTVCGVGYPGQGPWPTSVNNKNTINYTLWQNMIERCYSFRFITYKDCSVDLRWHNFQNFCHDIQFLEGYAEWHIKGGQYYHLDKDIKIKGNKIYSSETCLFVKRYDNIAESNKRCNITGLIYYGHRICDGYKEKFNNQKEFSIKHKISAMSVSKGTRNIGKVYQGWKYEIVQEEQC